MRTQPYLKLHPEAKITDTHLSVDTEQYRLATIPFIGSGEASERLYELEKANTKHREIVFKELGKVLGIPKELYWTEIVPEGLASILGDYQPGSAIAAAIGFLKEHGFEVRIPQS